MKRSYKLAPLLAFLFLSAFASAQNAETDSLVKQLTYAKEDTNKVNLLWNIGSSVIYQNGLAAIPYYKAGVLLAKKLGYDYGVERCYNATSLAYSYNGQYDSALVYISEAIPYAHKAGRLRRLQLVYINRADVHSNLQQFNAALKDCDTALEYAKKDENRKGLGRIYAIMSDIYFAQKQYSQGMVTNELATSFFKQANDMQMVAMMYSDRADQYAQKQQPDKAIALLLEAIRIGDSLNDVANLSAYNCALAQTYILKKQFKEAGRRAFMAFDYASQSGNVTQQGVIYQVIGFIYSQQENHKQAVSFHQKAYEIFSEAEDLIRKYTSAKALAEEYHKLGDVRKAYHYLNISSALNDSLNKQHFDSETAQLQTALHVSQKDQEIELLRKNKQLQQQQLRQQTIVTIGVIVIAILALVGIWLLMNRYRLRQRMKELELRSKIAADLHDDVGSTLSSIRMYSDIVKQQPNQTDVSAELLGKISSNSKEMIENMSDIVWMIKPGNDEFINVENRMLNFANNICTPAGINFDFIKDEAVTDVKIPMEQRRDIYLIFKEAVNNAVKYARCSSIHTSISIHKHRLLLSISDDGDGFDMTTAGSGNGLANMEKRAVTHGGTFTLQSAPGEGTELLISLPL